MNIEKSTNITNGHQLFIEMCTTIHFSTIMLMYVERNTYCNQYTTLSMYVKIRWYPVNDQLMDDVIDNGVYFRDHMSYVIFNFDPVLSWEEIWNLDFNGIWKMIQGSNWGPFHSDDGIRIHICVVNYHVATQKWEHTCGLQQLGFSVNVKLETVERTGILFLALFYPQF